MLFIKEQLETGAIVPTLLIECKWATCEPLFGFSHLWLTHGDAVGYQMGITSLVFAFEVAPEYHQGLVILF